MNELLNEALRIFDMEGAQAEFIQHNENLTYRMDDKYLLRIHKAAQGVHVDHDLMHRKAELAFLRHLAAQGVTVQIPVAEAVLAEGTMATLLTWLPGSALSKDRMSLDLLRQAGALTFRLHEAAHGFVHHGLRTYGQAHAAGLAESLRAMGDRHHLNRDDIHLACEAAQLIGSRLHSAADAFIPIHADLSPSNLLLTPDGLTPIDFSLLGLGHPMHDLSILMGNISSQAERQAVAAGYTAAGGRIDLPLLDAGYALGLLEALAFHADTWPREPWFAPRLTRWANEMLRPLAEGKPLLDETMYLVNLK